MERDAQWVLQKLVLSNLMLVGYVSIGVFAAAFVTIVWNLPLKIVLTVPAKLYIARIRARYARRRRKVVKGSSFGARMSGQARDMSSELAGLEARFNEIAFACSRVRRGRPPLGPRMLAAIFNRDDVRAELRGGIREAMRSLSEEYYQAAALSDDEAVRDSGILYQKWSEAPAAR